MEVSNFEDLTKQFSKNNAQWAKKETNYEPIRKFNFFFKDKTNKAFERDEFPLFANEDCIVDTSVPVVHHVSGPRVETGSLYLFLREQQQALAAPTPEFVTTDTINQAKLLGIDVSMRENEKPVFYPSSHTDEFGNQVTKNIYYANLSQLNNPEAMMTYIKENYREKQHERNVTNKAKFEAGEYEEFYEAREDYPEYKGVNGEITIEPYIPEDLMKKYAEIEQAKLEKSVNLDEYKVQSSAVKKDIAAYIMGSMIKAGLSGVCVKMYKGDNELFKEGIQTVSEDKKGWLTKWCKEAQNISKNLSDIVIDSPAKTMQPAGQEQTAVSAPAKTQSKPDKDEDFGFGR